MTPPNVVYVMADKMGGLININASLMQRGAGGAMPQHVVLTRNALDHEARFAGTFAAASVTRVEYTLPIENLHAVMSRLWRAIPAGEGVLVANDLLELAMLHLHDPQRAVMQIVHGDYDYYYSLAERHEAVIDVFIAYSQTVYNTLKRRLPARARDIHHLPYAIELPARVRTPQPGSLRLLFLGRLDRAKGVFDLPVIDALLVQRGVDVKWSIIGAGPAAVEVQTAWAHNASVEWLGQLSSREVLERLPDFDVLILPTHAEGLPLVIVEAMAAGVVPIATDLPSIADLVTTGHTGQLVTLGDVGGFAAAIERLDADQPLLERWSAAARDAVIDRFDPVARSADYRALFGEWQTLRRPRAKRLPLPYGSRLDQRWLPNPAVRAVRRTLRRLANV
jgi:glycosyltransferase involved in cell wall biosynthesis